MINLASLFFDRVLERTDHPALVLQGRSFSYAELDRLARRLWKAVATSGGERIGIFAHRSETAYAAVLGVLASGRSYVPQNPAFPVARNQYLLSKAAIDTLIVGPECLSSLRALLAADQRHYRLITLERDPALVALLDEFGKRIEWAVAMEVEQGKPCDVEPGNPAYVLFTSGSTGTPKGVVVGHGNVHAYLAAVSSLYPVFSDDRVSQTFDLTFDLSVHDMFTCWSAGATLVAYPASAMASPLAYTNEQGVTVWFSVPSLAAFLEAGRQVESNALPNLRLSLFCGEKLTLATVKVWRDIAPRSRVVNLYGPTEATVAIAHYEVPTDFDETRTMQGGVPIGAAFSGQLLEVRRGDGSVCELGETGALWLSGSQVAAGYLGEPGLTKERFVPREGRIWYKTGDLVVRDARDGLQFIGREDLQIKFMGYRIELGEIEHALMKVAHATQAVAGVAALRNGMDEIYAVLPAGVESHKKRIRGELKELLPAYMVPRHYFFESRLPVNASGKIDRTAIRAMVLEQMSASRGPVEGGPSDSDAR